MRENIRRWLWPISTVLLLTTLLVAVCLPFLLQRAVRAAYYSWGITCIIASYAEDHGGEPPANWQDLVGYEYHSKYLPDPRSMAEAARHIDVDFLSLRSYKDQTIASLPDDVITPKTLLVLHWISPSATLERYFRDGQLPEGSLSGQAARQLRQAEEVAPSRKKTAVRR